MGALFWIQPRVVQPWSNWETTMRPLVIFLCFAICACTRTPTPAERQEVANGYLKNLEDQAGTTRARERQANCARLPMPAVGMTRSQVFSSCWGQPDHAAESVTADGKQSVWNYP